MSTTSNTIGYTPTWLQRLGAYSFWFFLIKGLCWLIAPAALAMFF